MAGNQPRQQRNRKRWLILLAVVVGLGGLAAAAYVVRGYMRERQVQTALVDGRKAYEEGRWNDARRLLARYLARRADDIEVLPLYAEANLRVRPLDTGALNQAANAYRRILRQVPDDGTAFDRLATIYESTGSFADLGQVAAARLERVPGDLRALLAAARDLLSRQKPSEVIDLLEPHLSADASNAGDPSLLVEVYVVLAEAELSIAGPRGSEAAIRWLSDGLGRFPDAAMLHVQRGALYSQSAALSRGDDGAALREKARADLAMAEGAASNDPRVLLALADQWLTLQETDRAEVALKRAAALGERDVERYIIDPAMWQAAQFLQAGRLWLVTNRMAEGAERAREIVDDIRSEAARFAILPTAIEICARAGDLERARKWYDEYLNRVNRMPNAAAQQDMVALLGAVIAMAGDEPHRVINLLEPMAERSDVPPVVRVLLGEAYARTGQYRRLASALESGGDTGGMTLSLVLRTARSFADRGEWARVRELLDQLGEADQSSVDVKVLRIAMRIAEAPADATGTRAMEAIVAELGQLRADNPRRTDVRLMLANAALARSDDAAAAAELRAASNECEEPLPAILALARLLTSTGKADEAESLLRNATQKFAGDALAWTALSQLMVDRRQPAAAAELLSTALEKVSDNEGKRTLRLRRAVLLLAAGDAAAGRQALEAIAGENASDVDSRALLLELPSVMADASVAQRYVDELKKIEGDSGLNWRYHQARVALVSRDWQTRYDEALTLLAYCINADPGWSGPVLLLGGAHERRGDFANAEATYKSGFRLTGDLAIADRLLALLQRQRRFVDARELLQRMEQAIGRRAAAARQIRLALDEGRSSDALSLLELGAAGEAAGPGELLRLATLTYAEKRDLDGAMSWLAKAEAAGAEPIAVARGRSAILDAAGKFDEALAALSDLVARAPTVDSHLLRGSYFAKLGRQAEADADFAAVASLATEPTGIAVQGEYFAQTGRLDDAIRTWEAGLTTYPDATVLMRGIARGRLVRAAAGDRDAVLKLVERLNALEPQNTENISIEATALLNDAAVDARSRVAKLLDAALTTPPAAADVYIQLANVALSINRPLVAEQLVQRGITFEPGNIDLLMIRAEQALSRGQLDVAHDFARSVQRREPLRRRAWEILLEVASSRGDEAGMREGLAAIEGLIRETPDDLGLLALRARVLIAMKQADGVIQKVEQLVAAPQYAGEVTAWLELARLYLAAKDITNADRCIAKAAEISADDPAVDQARLERFGVEGSTADIAALGEAAAGRGASGAAAAVRAAVLLSQSKDGADAALRIARLVAAQSTTNIEAQRLIADLTYAKRDVDEAERAWRAVLARDSDDAASLNNLAWLLAHDRKKPSEALPLSQRAVELSPQDPNFRDTLAAVLRMLDRNSDAVTEYSRAVELWPAGAPQRDRALYALARVAADTGNVAALRAFSAELGELANRDPRGVLSPEERKSLAAINAASGTP